MRVPKTAKDARRPLRPHAHRRRRAARRGLLGRRDHADAAPSHGAEGVPAQDGRAGTALQAAPGTEESSDGEDAPATTQALPATLKQLRSPALALDIALPWITGEPHGLYARVRAVLRQGATRWSDPFGFSVRWPGVAQPLPDPSRAPRSTR